MLRNFHCIHTRYIMHYAQANNSSLRPPTMQRYKKRVYQEPDYNTNITSSSLTVLIKLQSPLLRYPLSLPF
jgi:hypothetical protein